MKSVLLSIQPKWCELIASGKKTVEIRKTKPKIETPFKCYIYCTKQNVPGEILLTYNKKVEGRNKGFRDNGDIPLAGKVIGEFICDFIAEFEGEFWDNKTHEDIREKYEPSDFVEYGEYEYQIIAQNGEANWLCKKSCLDWEELRKYIGQGINDFYGWHISDLVIYDKPKELREFHYPDYYKTKESVYGWADEEEKSWQIKRPPQSWCYVEELEEMEK